jgi:hypothetical protein
MGGEEGFLLKIKTAPILTFLKEKLLSLGRRLGVELF